MRVKRFVYENISILPSFFLFLLMKINRKPEVIFGKEFSEQFTKLQNKSICQEEIDHQFLEIVKFAVENVPYYSKRYGGTEIKSRSDFTDKIGFINKDIVVDNFTDFISKDFDLNDYELQTTGGTSGKPLKIFQPRDRYVTELAAVYNAWSKVGYKFDIRAVMRNHKLNNNRKFQINPFTKEIQFDNFNIKDSYLTDIYKIIKRYKIMYLHAYPSAAYQFALHCKKQQYDLSFFKAFLCSSENILEMHRSLIENDLGIKILGFYGHTEKLVFASSCKYSDLYHVDNTYGFFELIDDMGQNIVDSGRIGEIVGSTFFNKGMPLIRYKTGDFAEYFGNVCPYCGEKCTVLKNIFGRRNGEKIYNKDGSSVSLTSLNLHGDIYLHIEGLQYYQPYNGVLEIRIIKGSSFDNEHEKQLLDEIGRKFNADINLNIKYVKKLQFQSNGKFLQLIN